MQKSSREIAYKVLLSVLRDESYSNLELKNNVGTLSYKEQSFVRELVYGVLENLYLIDFNLQNYLKKPIENQQTDVMIILRMGVYQLAKMHKTEDYAAIDECVKLTKKYTKGKTNFVNAILRSFQRNGNVLRLPRKPKTEKNSALEPVKLEKLRIKYHQKLVRYLSVTYSFNSWIVELLLNKYGEEMTEDILKASNERPPLTIRTNEKKISVEELLELLKKEKVKAVKSRLSQRGIYVSGKSIIGNELYKKGLFSVQDEASQIFLENLPKKHIKKVLDVCGAPGGKSLGLAEILPDEVEIICQDISLNKLKLVDVEAKRLGLKNVETRCRNGMEYNEHYCKKMDLVIVDAPCSGLGVVRRRPEIKLFKDEAGMVELCRIQRKILSTSINYVAEGGYIAYSTCTINTNENEDVFNEIVRKNKDFEVLCTKQLLPSEEGTDGFFFAIARRVK